MNNLELFEIYNFSNKKRYGEKYDGGYVIAELNINYDCYISCGIADEESFTRDFLNKHNYLKKKICYAFDGTIEIYPYKYTKNITFIKKNINKYNDKNNTNLLDLIEKYNNIFLNMDIEGCEYDWISILNSEQLNKFSQIAIEFHDLCNLKNYTKKINSIKKLNLTHYMIHAHGNNWSYTKNNFPNVLEITFINKMLYKDFPTKNKIPLPIHNLDFPNNRKYKDIILNDYPFNFSNKIIIGNSKKNTKKIILDKTYNNIKLNFYHNYKDTFDYIFKNNILIIKRTDINEGWGQNLIAYY